VIVRVAVVTFEYGAPFDKLDQIEPPFVLTCHWKEVGELLKVALNVVLVPEQIVDADG
jgi:hypothetical protein